MNLGGEKNEKMLKKAVVNQFNAEFGRTIGGKRKGEKDEKYFSCRRRRGVYRRMPK